MVHRFTRQELYDMVWSEPRKTLAPKFGWSDVALGITCRAADIPVPPRGYWAKLAAGKRVTRTKLPMRGLGCSNTILVGPRPHWTEVRNQPIGELPPPPSFEQTTEEVVERARNLVGHVTVPKSLANPHRAVADLLARDAERGQKYPAPSWTWEEPKFTTPAAKRRLRLMNAIFLGVAGAGFCGSTQGDEANDLMVTIGHQWVRFAINPVRPSRRRDTLFDTTNSGTGQPMTIRIGSTVALPEGIATEWTDTAESPLEGCIPAVVLSLVVLGELHYRAEVLRAYDDLVERKAAQEEAARRAREAEIQRALELERAAEARRRRYLTRQAVGWRKAGLIREMVATVSARPDAALEKEGLAAWRAWALAEADRLDPLCHPLNEVLGRDWPLGIFGPANGQVSTESPT